MVNGNFKILLRGLWRKKSFTLLNTLGLSVGISASLLIFLLIRYELSIDRFHSQLDRIYRVLSTETYRTGKMESDGCAPTPLADGLRRDFPQPELVAPVWKVGDAQFGIPLPNGGRDKQVLAKDVYFADAALFGIFDFPWLAGDPQTALKDTYTMAISRSFAVNWFGSWQNAIGKTIVWGDHQKSYKVTGILEDPPSNTDIPLQVVVSYATYRKQHAKELADPTYWDNFPLPSQCFFLLPKGQHIESMNAMLPAFVATHFTPLFANSDTRDSCFFQPLKEMHFNSQFERYGKRLLRQLLERPVSLDVFSSPATLLFLLGTCLLVTFLAGSYPGMVLARFDPVAAFKSKINTKTVGGISLRRSLIILQFAIAQLLIIGTLVIVRQMDFFRNRPMGFDRKAITLIDLAPVQDHVRKSAWFKSQVLQLPGVISASLCNAPPSTSGTNRINFVFEHDPQPENFELVQRYADSSYLSVFHLGLVAGRALNASDTTGEALFNETAVKSLGIRSPEAIIGKTFTFNANSPDRIKIVGVLRDFNSTSLREKIKPLVVLPFADFYGQLAVRLEPGKIKSTMARLQTLFTQTYPDQFFVAPFFDDTVVDFYNAEAIESTLFKTFAVLAIFISCLGLYGLVSFMVVQKTKEVGIRKVLGASVPGILYLFSREFVLLIGLAFLIAAPIGYYLMHGWLLGYYYHMEVGWGVFVFAIASSLVIALITVGAKAVKAALANPAKSLRTE